MSTKEECIRDIDQAIEELREARRHLKRCKIEKAERELVTASRLIMRAFRCLEKIEPKRPFCNLRELMREIFL